MGIIQSSLTRRDELGNTAYTALKGRAKFNLPLRGKGSIFIRRYAAKRLRL
jgi:hypothetical protein